MSGLTLLDISGGYRKKQVFTSLTVPRIPNGSLVSILGANGTGKSTLLKTIAGINHLHAGSISLNGDILNNISVQKCAELMAYMEQDQSSQTNLLAYESILTSLKLYGKKTNSEVHKQADWVFEELGINSLALKPMNQMSGGERQMIGFAHVLARSPQLMLLDEPTSALDLRKQVAVMNHVQHFVKKNNAIALVIVHDLNLAMRYSDNLIVLGNNGKILKTGAPEDVMTSQLLAEAYNVKGRVEKCSEGYSQVIIDLPLNNCR